MPPDTKKPSVALGVKVGIELGFWDVVGVFEGAADGDNVHVPHRILHDVGQLLMIS